MPTPFNIEPGTPATVRPSRMLLGSVASASVHDRTWIARSDGQVIGTSAVSQAWSGQPAGPMVMLAVMEAWRGNGVGRALLDAAEDHARRLGARGLHGFDTWPDPSPEMTIARRLGFTDATTAEQVTLDVRLVVDEARALLERLRAKQRVPADASVRPVNTLEPEQRLALAKLQASELGGDAVAVDAQLRAGVYDPHLTLAAFDADQLVGFTLVRPGPDRRAPVTFDAIVVHPEARRGWPAVLLKHECGRIHLSRGGTHCTMLIRSIHRDSRRYVDRLGGHDRSTVARPFKHL